ncbi:MAG: fasciclin domain-containing protein [Planctomycetota bacterium]|jgi:uncharacterized surface protein with fasciclin (FAS1) repeats
MHRSTLLLGATTAVLGFVATDGSAQCQSSKQASHSTCPASKMPVSVGTLGETGTIVETAIGAGSFKTLVAAVQAAGLVDALNGDGPFTVFAPTDEAFAKLPKGTIDTLLRPENKDMLVSILTYHVAPGQLLAEDVVSAGGSKTLNGQWIGFETKNGKVMVDNASVAKTDIMCSNGVIHVIDTVIMPSSDDIVTTASSAGKFGTLLAAATKAGLAGVLQNDGPFTVLAPTDEAFAKLPADTLEMLLRPENKDQLAAILKYHVIKGRVYSPDAVKAGKAKTLQGDQVTFAVRKGQPMVNQAKILMTDIDASNGVIHVIDSVILPPKK